MKRLLKFVLAVAAVFLITIPVRAANAPKSITNKGISLTPAIVNLSIDQATPSQSFKINIDNHLNTPITLTAGSLDFKSLNETGGVAFIGSSAGSDQHKYGLANWISLPQAVTLKPRSSQLVTVTIENREDLSPGGHYAAVLFKNNAGGASGTNKVEVDQVVATLVFLKKSGGEIFSLYLNNPNLGAAWLNLPTSLPLTIKNTGNTQTEPRGLVLINDPLGHEVARGILNQDSGLVLPGSTRLYQTNLFKTGTAWLPGRYKVTILYRSGDINQGKVVEYSIFYVNLPFFVFLLVLGLTSYRVIRLFRPVGKRRSIHKA